MPLRLALVSLVLAGCSCDSRGGVEASFATCDDGIDNDGDGLVDCMDPGCIPACPVGDGGGLDGSLSDGGPPLSDGAPIDASFCAEPIDVVFVIDVSTSMSDEVASIRTGIESIWTAARALRDNAQFSLVVFVDDVAAVGDCAPIGSIALMQAELMRWQDFTVTNAQPGGASASNSDCAENSLDALHVAATTCPWREGSFRILIHVTDDTFEERPNLLSGSIPVTHTYAETVAALVADEVRVGAFAAPGAGEFCGAGTSPDVGRGFHAPFMSTPSIPDATGGRAWSIRDVRAGTLDMAAAISEFTADEYCTLF